MITRYEADPAISALLRSSHRSYRRIAGRSSSSSSSGGGADGSGKKKTPKENPIEASTRMATSENWGVFWILVSGVCMSGLAVSIVACIAAAREGAKALLSPPPTTPPSAAAAGDADSPSVATTASRHDQHQPATDGESKGGRGSALGLCGAVEGKATEGRRDVLLPGGQTDLGSPRLSADAPCTGRARGAEAGVGGHGCVGGGEGSVPAGWQQQQKKQQKKQGPSGGRRLEGGGGLDAQEGAPVVRAGGEVKTGSGEDRTAVQNIFNNFHNLSDLLGLQKGAEDRMSSDELWDLAFAATKKRFEMLTRDLEANRVKLDRQIRDEKRRKPSKYGGAGGRTAKGARGSRDGDGAATAAAAAAAAAEAARNERVKALNVEGQVLEDLRQSLDDVLREWDAPLSDEEGIGVKSRSPSEDACSTSRNARGSGATATPNPSTRSSISPSLETPAGASGNGGDGAAPARSGSGAASADGALSYGSNIDGQHGRKDGNGGPGLAGIAAGAGAHGSRGVHGSGGGEGVAHPKGRCEAGSRSDIRNSSAIGIGSRKLGRLSSAPSESAAAAAAAAAVAAATQDSGRRRRRRSSSSSIESCSDSYTSRNRGASDVTASGPTANHRSTSSAARNRPCNDAGDATREDAPATAHRPAIQETGCFPPPLPRPAGARGVVEEARAFAPAQHLAVLQALLNGEEADGERGFPSDSDSDSDRDREEGTGGLESGAAKVEGADDGGVEHGGGDRA